MKIDENTIFDTHDFIHEHKKYSIYQLYLRFMHMCVRWGVPLSVCVDILYGLRLTTSGYGT